MKTFLPTALLALALLFSGSTIGQKRLNLYTDCECNKTLLKQELNYVNHTIDPVSAQVNLFIVTNYLSNGGRVYDLQFKGQQELAGNSINFKVSTTTVMTGLERDEYLTKRIELGLAGFLAGTDYADLVDLTAQAPPEPTEADTERPAEEEEEQQDKWNNWIFEVGASYYADIESRRSRNDVNVSIDADRTTPEWRMRARSGLFYRVQKTTSGGNEETAIRREQYLDVSVVRSISNHWSLGLFANASRDTRLNIDKGARLSPAIEYNFFDYKEVPFKELTAAYQIGWVYNDYIDTTTLFEISQSLARQSLDIDLRLRQRWGSVFAGVSASSYLHDLEQNRLSLSVNSDVRLFRGLSFRMRARYNIINDQIYLPLKEASLQDALLGLVQLPTSYSADISFGLSYTFGSLYNNVINTRL